MSNGYAPNGFTNSLKEVPSSEPEWAKHVNTAKRKIRSELSQSDWQKYKFASDRAADFEKLAAAGDSPPGGVARETHGQLSIQEFWDKYERRNIPCIISGIPIGEAWPASSNWGWSQFFERFGNSGFKVGKDDNQSAVRIRGDHFEEYMKVQDDDSPVYLFDNQFKGDKESLLQDYSVPSYFPDDYMALLPDDRPPYRWVGVGPKRSGTIMHQDPLCTSAWNTLLAGRKLWLLLPPETSRKMAKASDVMTKEDDDEAINHFLDLLPRKRAKYDNSFDPVICVQYPGDTIYVPLNWWHCVVNLDDTIAVTQNYCGRHNFADVWRSARKERPCWSHRWLRAIEKAMPEVAAEARRMNAEDNFDMMKLLERNKERKKKQQERRDQRALRAARSRCKSNGSKVLDEEAWWKQRRAQAKEDSGDSTASTSSSSSAESDDSSSEEGGK